MSYNFREYDQDQLFLMPPSVQEWVREDSLARFLSEVIDGMDARGRLDAFYAPYRVDGWGAPAFHPVMMLKVVLYAYTNGVTSSRRIEAMLEVDIAFRYLAANNQPDFRTINGFRTTHPRRDLMEAKLEKEEGKAAYAQRGSTVELSFGQMLTRGLERFRLRGKKKAGLEWSLWCTTHNLLKLWRHAIRTRGSSVPCTAALAA